MTSTYHVYLDKNFSDFRVQIKKFTKSLGEIGKCLEFALGEINENVWCTLEVFPKGDNFDCSNYMSVFLSVSSDLEFPIRAVYKIFLLDTNGNRKFTKSRDVTFTNEMEYSFHNNTWKNFLSLEELFKEENGLIKNETLTLGGEIRLFMLEEGNQFIIEEKPLKEFFRERSVFKPEDINGTICVLSDDEEENKNSQDLETPSEIDDIFNDRLFADVTIKFKEHSIKAHKVFLAQSSKKFYELLTSKENQAVLELKDDVEFEAIEEMINFIYEDKIKDMGKHCRELLKLAKEYQMQRLETYCNKYLNGKLELKNVLEILVLVIELGEGNYSPGLKTKCLNFIDENIRTIVVDDNWEVFISQHPSVFNEIFKYIMKETIACKGDGFLDASEISMRENVKKVYYKNLTETSDCDLLKNYEKVFLSSVFSDFEVEVDGRILKAHKVMLSAQSSYFSAMFSNESLESSQNRVVIEDFDFETIQELLRYMYCEKVENIEEHALNLLQAADKYNVLELKMKCERVLEENITVENFINILSIANLHDCLSLKSSAFDFLIQNCSSILEASNWDEFAKSHVGLLNEKFVDWVEVYGTELISE